MPQRREVLEVHSIVPGEIELATGRGEKLHLLHRIYAQVRLEVEVWVEHVRRIPCLLRDYLYDPLLYIVRGGGGRYCLDIHLTPCALGGDVLYHFPKGRIIPEVHTLVLGQVEGRPRGGEELHLLHRIYTKVRIQIGIDVYQLCGDPRLLREDHQYLILEPSELILRYVRSLVPFETDLGRLAFDGPVMDEFRDPAVPQPQNVLDNLYLDGLGRRYRTKPGLIPGPICREFLQRGLLEENECELGPEPCGQPQTVFAHMVPARGEVQSLKLRIHVLRVQIGYRYRLTSPYAQEKGRVLQAASERMAREPLCVHNENVLEPVTEGPSQRLHLRRR